MAHLLSIPEDLFIQHLLPCLDHNDLLRLRRVSKQTKAWADAYLWTPRPGHNGKWELRIDSYKEDQTLAAFLEKGLPPPSRLYIANMYEKGPSEQRSFFEDEHLEEFMNRYGKYVTTLRLNKLFIPFTSAKELGFYESLENLKELCCSHMITVGGTVQFEEKTRRAEEGSFLIRPTFKKLKIFKLDYTDCVDSMWTFINGVSNNLEELLHPFEQSDRFWTFFPLEPNYLAPVRELIERRGGGMKSQTTLVYDWGYLRNADPVELLRVFASCRDNGVEIKNLDARHLRRIHYDERGRIERGLGEDPEALSRIQFVGSIIHSLVGVDDAVFLLKLPALETITLCYEHYWRQNPGKGYAEWSNLRTMGIYNFDSLDYLEEKLSLPKLEELSLCGCGIKNSIYPRNLGISCGNVKKLVISNCNWLNDFFLGLWDGLPLLEDLTLDDCRKLTNKGFVGNGVRGSTPAFLNLTKLKHLTLRNPNVSDAVFRDVFRHLRLTSLKLSSDGVLRWITLRGIEQLLSGPFAETIVKLDLAQLQLENVSEEKLKKVEACFRSSKML